MNDKHLERLIDDIKRHEGYRDVDEDEFYEIYLDSLGNLTCGWGHHLLLGSEMPKEVCELLLKYDISLAISNFQRINKKLRDKLNPPRRRVIVEMIFILGLSGCMNFKKMWKAIKKEDWEEAATQLLDSKMAQQIGRRAFEMANILRKGNEY